MWGRQRMRKYHNRKVVVDGIVFDSMKEANRWKELKVLERAGQVRDLQRQVKFRLIPAQREWTDETTATGKPKKGKLLEHECSYIADFTYKNRYGLLVVEDVKGYKKGEAYALFVIKRKLMLWVHGIRIKEV